jgi:hypothetical protein
MIIVAGHDPPKKQEKNLIENIFSTFEASFY